MSLTIRNLDQAAPKKRNRSQLLALVPNKSYEDGRTKQCHKNECDINKIMARFDQTGTISHLAKYEGVYADFSDFDFHLQNNKLTQGNTIFAALSAELRREFGQSPAAFFAYVNDPKNVDELAKRLPALDKPGQQLRRTATPDADLEAAEKKEAAQRLTSASVLADAIKKALEPEKKPEGG